MAEIIVKVQNRAGIHARPSAILVREIMKYKSEVYFEKDDERINAKSIMGLLTLGAAYGSEIKVIAEGSDEAAAVAAVKALFDSKFEEN
jgi:phosphocarrier protein